MCRLALQKGRNLDWVLLTCLFLLFLSDKVFVAQAGPEHPSLASQYLGLQMHKAMPNSQMLRMT